MIALTDKEFSRIDFLYRCGVSEDEIADEIVSARSDIEEDFAPEVNAYIQYVFDTAR